MQKILCEELHNIFSRLLFNGSVPNIPFEYYTLSHFVQKVRPKELHNKSSGFLFYSSVSNIEVLLQHYTPYFPRFIEGILSKDIHNTSLIFQFYLSIFKFLFNYIFFSFVQKNSSKRPS